MSLNQFRNREEKARFEREEAAELEQRLAPIKAATAANLKKVDALQRLFWSQPLKHLATRISDNYFEADLGVTFPSTDEPQGGTRGRVEFDEFVRVVLPKSGWSVSESGSQPCVQEMGEVMRVLELIRTICAIISASGGAHRSAIHNLLARPH